ncbi:hypothetical protein CW354_04325 [Marinicaulis flavus]|uniref:Uncharacterized protein n=2 Tax=Hyphococcus luteus TaxID=2058213 RepID=A0A2S7K9L6_9PROT|nr:hypothetical protein CW354_04325 [Marinicaulis flavus]
MLVAVAIAAAMVIFGGGKNRVDTVIALFHPLFTAAFIFLLLWFGLANLFLESWRRRKSNDYKDNQD